MAYYVVPMGGSAISAFRHAAWPWGRGDQGML